MLRRAAALACLLLPCAAACSESVAASPPSNENEAASACLHPKAILATSSASHAALLQWSAAPIGDAQALASLTFACDAAMNDDRGGTDRASCTLLGLIYASGEGTPRNMVRAQGYLQRNAGCGFSFDALDMATSFRQRIHGATVACCGRMDCEPGCAAQCDAAMEQVRGELEPALTKACDRGLGTGCFMLSQLEGQYIQLVGRLTPRATVDANQLLERACARGVGPACANRGYRAYEDPPLMEAYLAKACAAHWGAACLEVGNKLDGDGKRAEAVSYYERACTSGMPFVCTEVGDMLSNGDGVPVDHERAVQAYAKGWLHEPH